MEGIGTQFDDHENRKQIKKMRSVIKSKVTSTQANLKSGKRSNPQSKIILDRQSAQLDKQINLFQSLLEKEKAMIKTQPQPSGGGGGGGECSSYYRGEGSTFSVCTNHGIIAPFW